MALEKTLIINGLSVINAYIRVDTISGYKGNITISVNTYATKDEFSAGTGYLKQKIYTFIPSVADGSTNFIKQAYEYLKTTADFKDAINVLDTNQTA